jgi:NAD(P)H-hydrate epimerase
MIPVVTAKEMQTLDRRTIEEIGIPGLVLMENAAMGLVHAVEEILCHDVKGRFIRIYCGTGNNGGDGFAIARHLMNRGAKLEILLVGSKDKLTPDAKANHDWFSEMGGTVTYINKEKELEFPKAADLAIDALLGTGLQGAARGLTAKAIEAINRQESLVVAVDIPSGVEGSTGKVMGPAVKAQVTVTMGLPKVGLMVPPGRNYAGDVKIVDIGIPNKLVDEAKIQFGCIECADVLTMLPHRHREAHKGDCGKLFLLAGSPGFTGAATLATLTAIRTGVGLARLGIPKSLNPILEAKLTEGMTWVLEDRGLAVLHPDAVFEVRRALEWADALVLGPGISMEESVGDAIEEFLPKVSLPTVIDADGLNQLGDRRHLLERLPKQCVLTPHPGEMARLTGLSLATIMEKPIEIAREWAGKWRAVVVLKGAPSFVARPDGMVWMNPTGNPGMASGGTGDVLTGMIGGFLAQGLAPWEAGVCGVWLHGTAGDRAAQSKGVLSLMASDIIEEIPEVIRSMGFDPVVLFPEKLHGGK